MKTATQTQTDIEMRDEWLQTVKGLKGQIKSWLFDEPDWEIMETETKEIAESPLGQYTIPIWSIQTPEGEVRLEPIARNYPGRGVVELFAWPTLYRVRLIQDEDWGGWRIRTDSGIFLRQEWSRENFITLIRDLVNADA